MSSAIAIQCSPDEETPYQLLGHDLIRIGVLGDGHCFFHALAYAYYPGYPTFSLDKRKVEVDALCHHLAETCTRESWRQLGKGEVYRAMIFEKCSTDPTLLELETELQQLSGEWKTTSVIDVAFWLEKHSQVKKSVSNWIPCLRKIEQDAYDSFLYHLEYDWMDQWCLEYVGQIFERNFLMVDGETGKLIRGTTENQIQYPLSILMCWVNENHFELIAQAIDSDHIKTEFTSDDSIVQALVHH